MEAKCAAKYGHHTFFVALFTTRRKSFIKSILKLGYLTDFYEYDWYISK